MERGYFYPSGREKTHSLGALDVALWDLKGKALGVPVWQLLGGKSRDYVECYATVLSHAAAAARWKTRRAPVSRMASAPIAPACAKARISTASKRCARRVDDCQAIRQGVGKDGAWAIDFHGTMDPEDAITLATELEPLHPFSAKT